MPQHNRSYWSKRQSEAAQYQYEKSSKQMMYELKKIYEDMSNSMAKEVDNIYFKLLEDDIRRTDIWTYKHYRDLSDRMAILAANVGVQEEAILNTELELALKEIYDATPVQGTSFSLLNETMVKQIIARPWSEKHFSQAVWDNKAKMLDILKRGITESIVLGKSKDKLVAEIMDKCGKGFNDADRLVRTELMHTINEGQRQRYKDAGFTKLEILVAEDERTCERCEQMQGKIVDIDSDEIPPFHPRCRCNFIPSIDLNNTQISVQNINTKIINNDIIEATRQKIKSDKQPKKIDMGKQKKHIIGTNEYNQKASKLKQLGQYGPSYLNINYDEIQELIDKYSGTGQLKFSKNGLWENIEIILDNEEVVGRAVNNITGKEADTSVFKIHYSETGVHIVPDYPSKKKGG